MTIGRVVYSVLAIALGVFMIVYGEMDDSPGGQFLGLLMVIAGVVSARKIRKKTTR